MIFSFSIFSPKKYTTTQWPLYLLSFYLLIAMAIMLLVLIKPTLCLVIVNGILVVNIHLQPYQTMTYYSYLLPNKIKFKWDIQLQFKANYSYELIVIAYLLHNLQSHLLSLSITLTFSQNIFRLQLKHNHLFTFSI